MSSKSNQGFSNNAVFPNKTPVEIIKTKEWLNAFYRPRWLLVPDNLDLLRVDLDTVGANNKAKILSPSNAKLIFLDVRLEASVH